MSEDDYYYDDPGDGGTGGIAAADDQNPAEYDESGPRFAWKVTSIVIVVLTLLLNLILVGVIVVKVFSIALCGPYLRKGAPAPRYFQNGF